jgi:hypothetical protein
MKAKQMIHIIGNKRTYSFTVGLFPTVEAMNYIKSYITTDKNLDWVNHIEVTGEDVDYISDNFESLPMRRNAETLFFYGDMARFVLMNL